MKKEFTFKRLIPHGILIPALCIIVLGAIMVLIIQEGKEIDADKIMEIMRLSGATFGTILFIIVCYRLIKQALNIC